MKAPRSKVLHFCWTVVSSLQKLPMNKDRQEKGQSNEWIAPKECKKEDILLSEKLHSFSVKTTKIPSSLCTFSIDPVGKNQYDTKSPPFEEYCANWDDITQTYLFSPLLTAVYTLHF